MITNRRWPIFTDENIRARIVFGNLFSWEWWVLDCEIDGWIPTPAVLLALLFRVATEVGREVTIPWLFPLPTLPTAACKLVMEFSVATILLPAPGLSAVSTNIVGFSSFMFPALSPTGIKFSCLFCCIINSNYPKSEGSCCWSWQKVAIIKLLEAWCF